MTDSQAPFHCRVDVDLIFERFDQGERVQSVGVTAETDGTFRVSSTGKLARVPLRQLGRMKKALQSVVESTGQSVVIEHNGQQLARLQANASETSRWTIRWWRLLRTWLRSQ